MTPALNYWGSCQSASWEACTTCHKTCPTHNPQILPATSLFTFLFIDTIFTCLILQGFQGKNGPPGPTGVVGPQVGRSSHCILILKQTAAYLRQHVLLWCDVCCLFWLCQGKIWWDRSNWRQRPSRFTRATGWAWFTGSCRKGRRQGEWFSS